MMDIVDFLRSSLHTLPTLAKFAVGMAIIVGVPMLCRRIRLPAVVGLLLSGVVVGPHVHRHRRRRIIRSRTPSPNWAR